MRAPFAHDIEPELRARRQAAFIFSAFYLSLAVVAFLVAMWSIG